ncbi:hypothetical protein I4F81_008808 [Pyropia yezoensis]|uniref:Uncharacterized protein n=1 Tax=Pyropia yezoensis TaxID=2788 RepID=A0ACC3C889_PYRYE|nr:hypothetical protein I4F81_008808 [Neopyropia yezoensis]
MTEGTPAGTCPESLTFSRVATPNSGSPPISYLVATADAKKDGVQCTGNATLTAVKFSDLGVPPGPLADDLYLNDSTLGCVMKRTSTGSGEADEPACFDGSGVVELASGATVRMDALAVGDVVRVAAEAVSPVIEWSHRAPHEVTTYVRLVTASAAIDVTPGHYVYVEGRLVAAAAVAVGDRLDVASHTCGPSLEAVTRVEVRSAAEGVYAPHTLSGDIVVGGVRASTDTTAVAPGVAHMLLASVRGAFAVSGADVLKGMLAGVASGGILGLLQRLLPKGAPAY